MAEKLRKPQYRTVVNALEVLVSAVAGAYGPAENHSGLGDRMRRLERAQGQAKDVIARAKAAMETRRNSDANLGRNDLA